MQLVCGCCNETFEYETRAGRVPLYCSHGCRYRVNNAKKEAYRLSLCDEVDLDPIPPPEVVAEKRHAYSHYQSLFGDPLPGRSALDRKVRQ
jgi:hypothetical protein